MKVVIIGRNFTAKNPDAESGITLLRNAGFEIDDYSSADFGGGTPAEQLLPLIREADVIVAGVEPYPAELLAQCPRLRLIARRGIGYDAVDMNYCRAHGITVTRTTGAVEGSVAETVLSYILYFARRVDLQSESMHRHEWKRVMMPGAKSRVLGLVGFGGIGKEIAKRAVPFGMEVVYTCRHPDPAWDALYGVRYLPLEELLAVSDYVSVNVPLTEETRGLFGAAQFARMKPGSVFINIARSPVADVDALAESLRSGHLSGCAVDVYPAEPCTDSPLADLPNALLTPHTASFTEENFALMNRIAAENVVDFVAGNVEEKYLVR